jgi:hypothetical protein
MHISAQTDFGQWICEWLLTSAVISAKECGRRPEPLAPNGTSSKTWWLIHVRKGLPQQTCRTPRPVRGEPAGGGSHPAVCKTSASPMAVCFSVDSGWPLRGTPALAGVVAGLPAGSVTACLIARTSDLSARDCGARAHSGGNG